MSSNTKTVASECRIFRGNVGAFQLHVVSPVRTKPTLKMIQNRGHYSFLMPGHVPCRPTDTAVASVVSGTRPSGKAKGGSGK